MSVFNYQALTTQGQTTNGTLEGESERQVRQHLREQGLIPLEITATATRQQNTWTHYRLSLSELTLISRHLAALLSTGVPIAEALQTVALQANNARIKTVLTLVISEIMAGQTLQASFMRLPRAFPRLYAATVGAGEASGQLDTVFLSLADYLSRQQAIRRKWQQALFYPLIMLTVAIAVVFFLLTFVVPKMINVFSDAHQHLPLLTRWLIAISHGIQHGWWLGLLFIIAAGLLIRVIAKNSPWQKRWQLITLRLPIIGRLRLQTNIVRFCYTLAVLLQAGVDILAALETATTVIGLIPLKEKLQLAISRVREGSPLHQALRTTGYFSPMTLHFIANGEATSQLAIMLQHAATQQEIELNQTIDTGLTLFEPLLILVMGSVVLFIVLAILLPIFSMDQLTRLS